MNHRRPPSSASVRQNSASPFVRPSSSASTRPPSSASSSSLRPSSSAASARYSAASRAASRATQRPTSRVSLRPNTRQSIRLNPLYQTLVTQLTGLTAEENDDDFHYAVEHVSRSLDQTARPAGSVDLTTVDKQIQGLVQKARIKSQDTLADALQTAYQRLKTHTSGGTDLDAEILASRLPTHLHFLLTLAQPPSHETIHYADEYQDLLKNPGKAKSGLTWSDILAEEPFEGQHWEGVYGLPRGAVRTDGDQSDVGSSGTSPSLSPWDDEVDGVDDQLSPWETSSEIESQLSTPPPHDPLEDVTNAATERFSRQIALYSHRDEVESLQALQYWRSDWKGHARVDRPFDIGDPSTLHPAFRRAVDPTTLTRKKYIPEHDAVREVLMGLQGRRNLSLKWSNSDDDLWRFVPDSEGPSLLHLSTTAQDSILSSFARTATTVEHLRRFCTAMFKTASKADSSPTDTLSFTVSRRNTRTFEAFSEAVDKLVRDFDLWCATQEEEICMARAGLGPPRIISLLDLEKSLRDRFSQTFDVLLTILHTAVQRATHSPEPIAAIWTFPDLPKRMPPAASTAQLLDALLHSAQDHAAQGDSPTAAALLAVFAAAAAPLWGTVRRWLADGMPIRDHTALAGAGPGPTGLGDEFFVEDNELPLLDPDFWADGFVLRGAVEADGAAGEAGVPAFLRASAPLVLAAGKAVGLLHALGMPMGEGAAGQGRWMDRWRGLGELLESARLERETAASGRTGTWMAADDFARLVYEELHAPCVAAQATLTRVLVEECELWVHLSAIEEVYLMRRGDVMTAFLDVLFTRMDSSQSWNDFHFLNTAFGDVVAQTKWLDPALVRISHRGSRDKTLAASRSVRAVEGLFVEYAVPFPLTYIWGPRAMQVYSTVFVLLLQIRRAKNALDRILARLSPEESRRDDGEMKMFYAMRGKLSWFVNVLLNFICTDVLHTQIMTLHTALRKATSLDDMIHLHDDHLSKLESRCLLRNNTAPLHRAMISILDMALHFSDCFVAYAGSRNTHDVSRQSITPMKAHRSRRLKRQRKNVIGFAQPVAANIDTSSDSDTDDDAPLSAVEPEYSLATAGISFAEESFVIRLDKMASELDALVRFVRRGVEGLAGGANEAAAVFDVFAFQLEDWDQ